MLFLVLIDVDNFFMMPLMTLLNANTTDTVITVVDNIVQLFPLLLMMVMSLLLSSTATFIVVVTVTVTAAVDYA